MNEFNEKEYNSVILGALLHDVGKLLHRGDDKYKYNDGHEAASAKFIENNLTKLKNDKLYDINIIKILVRYHDTKISKTVVIKDEFFKDKTSREKTKIWKLIKLIKRADSYSCKERDTENAFANRTLPLDSIFSYINLDLKQKEHNFGKYNFAPFSPLNAYPGSITILTDKEIDDAIKGFENAIPDFSKFNKIENVFTKWLNILQKYMWSVPSDTRYEKGISDVSLYDHSRSTAAFAACLYKRHMISIAKGKRFSWNNEFYLIGGDFSGIQDYIFQITNRDGTGVSKRLRARSFFIYLFSEVTIHKILHKLALPIFCDLFSAGGKFLLLAPNIENIENELQNVKLEIENEIHKAYFNQFSFLMSWMPIRGFKEFKENDLKAKFKVYNFFKLADDMFYKLELEKSNKSKTILSDPEKKQFNINYFKSSKLYREYQVNNDCQVCVKGPATH
ncbi:MAG: type III-A CRISPR-associated protein Cas10/Csm1 [Candidatus Firestonebacteria bacterium]|nr:type III-A CRISPR-associated protein Cas10/Csm1 [Candidatus Firestonebacteria bacterium]